MDVQHGRVWGQNGRDNGLKGGSMSVQNVLHLQSVCAGHDEVVWEASWDSLPSRFPCSTMANMVGGKGWPGGGVGEALISSWKRTASGIGDEKRIVP